jgi:hypothetical protein
VYEGEESGVPNEGNMPRFPVGSEVGRWTVVGEQDDRGKQLCICECGDYVEVATCNLGRGSFGCAVCHQSKTRTPQRMRDSIAAIEVLGGDKALYWQLRWKARNAIGKCTKLDDQQWKDYGGRGIGIYQPWLDDINNFIDYLTTLYGYDMDLWLDRIDNEGNYEPGNLRFVTPKESADNRRRRSSRKFDTQTSGGLLNNRLAKYFETVAKSAQA